MRSYHANLGAGIDGLVVREHDVPEPGLGQVLVRVRASNLAQEQITGTPDSAIPGQKVDTGAEAKAFADVIRKHTLEATGGQTYSEMGRFLNTAYFAEQVAR